MEFKQDGQGFAESEPVMKLSAEAYISLEEMETKANNFPAKPAKPFPRIGETLQVRHQVKRAGDGTVLGIQRADGRPANVPITAVYMDGSVRCGATEVWQVKPGTTGHWETINPDRAERS